MTLITQRAVFPLTEPFNIEPPRSTLEVRTVFARASGSDAIGDGKTEATAYRTFQRAIMDVPTFIPHNVRYVVDITGIGTEDLLPDFTLPILASPDPALLDLSARPVQVIAAPLTIFAQPTIVDTITGPEFTVSSDPTSNIRTLNTTKNYTANEHKNRYVVGSDPGHLGVICSNTAGPDSDLEITDTFDLTPPVDIVEESAELRSPDGASLIVAEQLCEISWQGIKFTNAGNGIRSAIQIRRQNAAMVFTACTLDGIDALGGGCLDFDISTAACNHLRMIASRGTQWHITNSFIESLIHLSIEQVPQAAWGACVWDGNPPIGRQHSPTDLFDEVQTIAILLFDSIVRNGTGVGVQVPRLSTVKLKNVSLHDCAGDGIFCEGKLRCQNVQSSAGSANSGFGIQIRNGGQVQVDSATDINAGAATELKVGGNAATTWSTFRTGTPPFNEVDLGAAQPELCRLWQP